MAHQCGSRSSRRKWAAPRTVLANWSSSRSYETSARRFSAGGDGQQRVIALELASVTMVTIAPSLAEIRRMSSRDGGVYGRSASTALPLGSRFQRPTAPGLAAPGAHPIQPGGRWPHRKLRIESLGQGGWRLDYARPIRRRSLSLAGTAHTLGPSPHFEVCPQASALGHPGSLAALSPGLRALPLPG